MIDEGKLRDWLSTASGWVTQEPEFFREMGMKPGPLLRITLATLSVSEFDAIDVIAEQMVVVPSQMYAGAGKNFRVTAARLLAKMDEDG